MTSILHRLATTVALAVFVLGGLLMAGVPPASAAELACSDGSDFPCAFQIEEVEIQKVPAIFKFQARIAQSKLPVGDAQFASVFVKVLSAGTPVCKQQLDNVQVKDSVLNLTIGEEITCALDAILAEKPDLTFQVCLGQETNCLQPVKLGASPYAIKASYASVAQKAHKANEAATASYAHRVAVDDDLFLRKTISTGFLDFKTPRTAAEAGTTLFGGDFPFATYAHSAFLQWVPVLDAAKKHLHIVARGLSGSLGFLDTVVLAARKVYARGALVVTGEGVVPDAPSFHVEEGALARFDGPVEFPGGFEAAPNLVVDSTGNATFKGNVTFESGAVEFLAAADVTFHTPPDTTDASVVKWASSAVPTDLELGGGLKVGVDASYDIAKGDVNVSGTVIAEALQATGSASADTLTVTEEVTLGTKRALHLSGSDLLYLGDGFVSGTYASESRSAKFTLWDGSAYRPGLTIDGGVGGTTVLGDAAHKTHLRGTGNITAEGNLAVNDDLSVSDDFWVTGDSQLTGTVTHQGATHLSGDVTFYKNLSISGSGTLSVKHTNVTSLKMTATTASSGTTAPFELHGQGETLTIDGNDIASTARLYLNDFGDKDAVVIGGDLELNGKTKQAKCPSGWSLRKGICRFGWETARGWYQAAEYCKVTHSARLCNVADWYLFWNTSEVSVAGNTIWAGNYTSDNHAICINKDDKADFDAECHVDDTHPFLCCMGPAAAH